ncbi:hypothetical protein GOP47_0013704 [Adiantum capillus-veneris]|uniref:Fe2OG dioxygenase domain-containing protein n=1 Tax=Adiantum capillus-veneris TaxID=13818 RepID=A0A9D4ZDH2_ADICA|nr:hypothetical protein GOP47_0013704 [Adiantum capillus-veneris]
MGGLPLVQTLSTEELPQVPARFVQPLNRRHPCHGAASIPVIDLHALLHPDPHSSHIAAQALASACEEWGFFQIINHGIPTSVLEDVRKLVRDFLDLPMEEKLKRPIKFEPYHPTGYGRTFDLSEETLLDWVDALIHYLSPPDLKDPDYWPDKPAGYRKTVDAYGIEVTKLVKSLLAILSKSLGLDSSALTEAFGGDASQVILRVNHYPRCQQPDLVLGLRPHSDGSAVTVLLHDEVEGLQVKKDGLWWTVKPLPNALIVNMGDMMELVSNGRFTSMEHRTVVSSEAERVSVVVFYTPAASAYVGPLATKGTEQHDAIYNCIKYEDYLSTYMNTDVQGKDRINSLLI